MKTVDRPGPPKGWKRALWRLPIHLYRMGLGPLLPRRIMLLTHLGRVSGAKRQAVIEVVHHDADGYIAASGFGPKADWYQNVMRHPNVIIQVGGRMIPVTAVPLATDEAAEVMARYASRFPGLAKRLCKIMGFEVDGSVDDFRQVGRHIPFVRFTPRDR